VQIVVAPPAGVTVWWYTPKPNNPMWYIQAMRPRMRSGELDGVEYCVLSQLTGTAEEEYARYRVLAYCNLQSRYTRVFSSTQHTAAIQYMRRVALLAYRRAIEPRTQLWWHQWSSHLNDKLEPFYAH